MPESPDRTATDSRPLPSDSPARREASQAQRGLRYSRPAWVHRHRRPHRLGGEPLPAPSKEGERVATVRPVVHIQEAEDHRPTRSSVGSRVVSLPSDGVDRDGAPMPVALEAVGAERGTIKAGASRGRANLTGPYDASAMASTGLSPSRPSPARCQRLVRPALGNSPPSHRESPGRCQVLPRGDNRDTAQRMPARRASRAPERPPGPWWGPGHTGAGSGADDTELRQGTECGGADSGRPSTIRPARYSVSAGQIVWWWRLDVRRHPVSLGLP